MSPAQDDTRKTARGIKGLETGRSSGQHRPVVRSVLSSDAPLRPVSPRWEEHFLPVQQLYRAVKSPPSTRRGCCLSHCLLFLRVPRRQAGLELLTFCLHCQASGMCYHAVLVSMVLGMGSRLPSVHGRWAFYHLTLAFASPLFPITRAQSLAQAILTVLRHSCTKHLRYSEPAVLQLKPCHFPAANS